MIRAGGDRFEFSVAIPGRHVLYAVMAALGAGLEMGLSKEEILRGLSKAGTISGRVNVMHNGGLTIIDDCYNAAPASMEAGLDLLSKAGGETVAILGDMGELGPEAPQLHARVGRYAAEKKIKLLVGVGELSRHMCEACAASGGRAIHFDSRAEIIDNLVNLLPKNGIVLIKASHFMKFDEIVEKCKELS